MIDPPLGMCGTAARVRKNVPYMFVLIVLSNCSVEMSVIEGQSYWIPEVKSQLPGQSNALTMTLALLTRISI